MARRLGAEARYKNHDTRILTSTKESFLGRCGLMKASMLRSLLIHLSCCSLALCISLLTSSAFGQYLVGPGASPPPPPGVGTVGATPVIKTPKLKAGDLFSIPIAVHNPGPAPLPNWAGVLVEVHLGDPSEVDIVSVKVGGVPVPHPFPVSGGPGSTAAIFTVFHPSAFLSGISLQPSSFFPAITLDLVAKNTNPINNSDVDINLKFADIYHQPGVTLVTYITNTGPSIHRVPIAGSTIVQRPTPGSTTWQLPDSHRWLVPSSIGGLPDLHLTANGHQANSQIPFPNAPPTVEFESKFVLPRGVDPATGHFIHLPAGTVHRVTTVASYHVVGNSASSTMIPPGGVISTLVAFIPGSQIFAVPFLATASIGIEHIPEPAVPILLLGGLASLACGFRARRRRQQLT